MSNPKPKGHNTNPMLIPALTRGIILIVAAALRHPFRIGDHEQEEEEDRSDGLALSNSIMELADSLEEGETKDPANVGRCTTGSTHTSHLPL